MPILENALRQMQTFGLWMWAEGKIVHGRNIMLTLTDCDGNVVTAEGKVAGCAQYAAQL